jgi:hypothetical protein
MKTDQDIKNDAKSVVADLLDEAKKIGKDIEETNKMAREGIDIISAKVDKSVTNLKNIYSDFDKILNGKDSAK